MTTIDSRYRAALGLEPLVAEVERLWREGDYEQLQVLRGLAPAYIAQLIAEEDEERFDG